MVSRSLQLFHVRHYDDLIDNIEFIDRLRKPHPTLCVKSGPRLIQDNDSWRGTTDRMAL